MSAQERKPMGPGKAAAAYGRAVAKLEPLHAWHFFAVTEHVRHLRHECASVRNKLRDEERRNKLLLIELEELRREAA